MILKMLIALGLIVMFTYIDGIFYKYMKGDKETTITKTVCMLPIIGIILLMEIFGLLVLWSL